MVLADQEDQADQVGQADRDRANDQADRADYQSDRKDYHADRPADYQLAPENPVAKAVVADALLVCVFFPEKEIKMTVE